MKYHVFNKKPSQSAIEEATKCSDPQEQMENLALATVLIPDLMGLF